MDHFTHPYGPGDTPETMKPREILRPDPVNAPGPAKRNIQVEEIRIENGLQDQAFRYKAKGEAQYNDGLPAQAQPAGNFPDQQGAGAIKQKLRQELIGAANR